MISNLRVLSKELLDQTLSCLTRELLFSTEQNHPEYPLQEKGQSEGNESSRRRPFPSRSLTWSTNTSGSLVPMILSRIMQTYLQLFFEMMICRNSIRWRKSHLMTSWKVSTNWQYESLTSSRPYWNCMKAGPYYHRLTTMVKRSIEQNLRMMNFEARNGNYGRSAVVKNSGTKQREQTSLGNCWKWQANGQCSKGGNCSFRHDTNKRAKSTQPNPSPGSSTQQSVKDASRTRSPRGRSPSGKMARLPLHNSILWKMASSGVLVLQVRNRMQIRGKSALMRNARLTNSLARSFKRMVTKVQWLYWRKHDNSVAYFRIWSRRSLQRFCGRAQTQWSQSDVFDSLQPC